MGASRGRRTGLVLIIVILLVVIIAAGALLLLSGGNLLGGAPPEDTVADGSEEAEAQAPASTIDVIVASRDIPRGKVIEDADVGVMAWPLLEGAEPPLGIIVADEQSGGVAQVVGRIARMDILSNELILETRITPGGDPTEFGDVGSDAALRIPPGRVALAIPINRLSSVAYALREGDHVDILMSFRFVDVDEEFQTIAPNDVLMLTDDPELAALGLQALRYPLGREERGLFGSTAIIIPGEPYADEPVLRQTTQLTIDNVEVLRVGDWPLTDLDQPLVVSGAATPEAEQPAAGQEEAVTPTPEAPAPDVVTLVMTRQDALVLKFATEQGVEIDLALRSALDDEIEDIVTEPVTLNYVINTRNVPPPEKLPVALDPRIDLLNAFRAIDTAQPPDQQP